jgi:hypothetical protein
MVLFSGYKKLTISGNLSASIWSQLTNGRKSSIMKLRILILTIAILNCRHSMLAQVDSSLSSFKLKKEINFINNDSFICICFEGWFKSELVLVKNKDEGIILDTLITTIPQLGLAKKIWISKASFPVEIRYNNQPYTITEIRKKYVYINADANRRLLFKYSDKRRKFM